MGALHFLHHWLKMTTNNERQSRWIPAYAGMTSKIVSGFALVLSTVSPSSGKTDRGGVVEKPGTGSERVPLVLHGHRIDLTLSSRRRSNATEKGLLKNPVSGAGGMEDYAAVDTKPVPGL